MKFHRKVFLISALLTFLAIGGYMLIPSYTDRMASSEILVCNPESPFCEGRNSYTKTRKKQTTGHGLPVMYLQTFKQTDDNGVVSTDNAKHFSPVALAIDLLVALIISMFVGWVVKLVFVFSSKLAAKLQPRN